MMKPYFLIFGFGYTAKFLAPQLILQGFKVLGTKRALDSALNNNREVKLIAFNDPKIKDYLRSATHILVSIPPNADLNDLVLIKYADLIKQQAVHLEWLGYLSSTGVYGDHQGKWVNEQTPCNPDTPTGIARLKAEQAWLSYASSNHLPLHIFRLSGIYGPGRNALERLKQGKKYSIFKKDQVFCRIHVEDIVSTLLKSMKAQNPLSIYNLADDEPAAAHIVDAYAASLLHQKPPPLSSFTEIALSPLEQAFYSNNRRVSNEKMKIELKITLSYPSYREGLNKIWRGDFEST